MSASKERRGDFARNSLCQDLSLHDNDNTAGRDGLRTHAPKKRAGEEEEANQTETAREAPKETTTPHGRLLLWSCSHPSRSEN